MRSNTMWKMFLPQGGEKAHRIINMFKNFPKQEKVKGLVGSKRESLTGKVTTKYILNPQCFLQVKNPFIIDINTHTLLCDT